MIKVKPVIAISACLLGQPVRYDGQDKRQDQIMDFFVRQYSDRLNIIPFCPEVAIGLGVPRPKIQVIRQKDEQIRVLGVKNHTNDVTELLQSYASEFLQQHPGLSHVIVKSSSPSCGYQSTPLMTDARGGLANNNELIDQVEADYQQIGWTSGMFVRTMLEIKPELQIAEETQLLTERQCQLFIQGMQQENHS